VKYILTTAATIVAIASASFADAPAGASAAPCDATQFTPRHVGRRHPRSLLEQSDLQKPVAH